MTITAYVQMGTPTHCPTCGKLLKRGMRVVYDGKREYDNCRCIRNGR